MKSLKFLAMLLLLLAGSVFADPDEKEDDDNSGMNPYYRTSIAY